ncbi:MAG TPA: hypothetical protein VNT75_19950, partial [Symbiobacteriaceae bacterium]|nr:hypothetical protein [Symbiobacteriaceae bacterium]
TIGTDAVKPLLRLRGEAACSLPYQGPYWLPDGSGIMVSTTRGPRLLRTDGTLETPKLPEKAQGWGVPVPAPDKPNLYAYDGTMVLDGAGKVLVAAVTHSEGQFYGTGSSRIHPWGETSDEVRFILRNTGKGVSCDPYIFPPEVEKAPFPAITGVETKVAAGDCVNLRLEYTKESAVVTCVPNGTRLVAAEPPGTSNKGQLGKWGNPAALSMGGEFWWYVRTEKGERGWVYLDSEYLTLAPARPGEPAPDQVQLRLEDELANLRYWYRVSLGELPCTQTTCLTSPTSFGNIEALVNWCASGPAELRKLPGFDPAQHGARLAPIEQSCQALVAAPKSLGELAETPAWKAKVKELLTALPPQP